MDENTTKIIKEKFDSLPETIQELILSTNYEETLLEIGKQYNLNVEQLGILERETTLVMMGLTPTKDFEPELTQELNVDKLKGSQIVKDINEKIFLKIRELLKLMNTPEGENPSVDEEKETPIKINTIGSTASKNIIISHQTEEDKNDTKILNSAGIEIIEKPTSPETKEEVHPILAQKLTGSFQVPTAKTQYSLDNITKTNAPAAASVPNVTTEKPKIPSVDPYREVPE